MQLQSPQSGIQSLPPVYHLHIQTGFSVPNLFTLLLRGAFFAIAIKIVSIQTLEHAEPVLTCSVFALAAAASCHYLPPVPLFALLQHVPHPGA